MSLRANGTSQPWVPWAAFVTLAGGVLLLLSIIVMIANVAAPPYVLDYWPRAILPLPKLEPMSKVWDYCIWGVVLGFGLVLLSGFAVKQRVGRRY